MGYKATCTQSVTTDEIPINKGIFQSPSHLLFYLAINPFSKMPNKKRWFQGIQSSTWPTQ